MDLLDMELVKALEIDANRSTADLAKFFRTSSTTIRRRINRLIEDNTLRIFAMPNPSKMGLPMAAMMGLKLENNRINQVMQTLFDKEETWMVVMTTGQFDVIYIARFRDSGDLARFIGEELNTLEGVIATETFICLETLGRGVHIDREVNGRMDSLDMEITKALELDARQSSVELAKIFHTSSATIRRRVKRLIENDMIRIFALANPEKMGLPVSAIIGLKVVNDRINSTKKALMNRPETQWIEITTGHLNIMCISRFSDNNDLARFIKEEVPKLEGVILVETFVCLESLLRNASIGRILNVVGNSGKRSNSTSR